MSNFEEIYERLKPILETYEPNLAVKTDEPGKYYLISKKPLEKKDLWFGGVEIKKNYVSFHLVPVYMFPEMFGNISAELKQNMQGKSCFSLKKPDKQIFGELADLTRRSFEIFKQKELI